MHTDHLIKNFEKRVQKNGLQYQSGGPASISKIEKTEKRLGVKFPLQVKLFYQTINGLYVNCPSLNILCLDDLRRDEGGKIHFATFDDKHMVCFDTKEINIAGQWDIVNLETGFKLTLTMASFWSNKIWAWIDKQRTVWQEEFFC